MYEIYINNFNLTNYIILEKLEGLNVPERKLYIGSYLLNNSGLIVNRYYKQRVLTIEGVLVSNNLTDYFSKRKNIINAFLSAIPEVKIRIDNKNYYLYQGKTIYGPIFVERAGEYGVADFRVEIGFEDFLIYDDEILVFETQVLPSQGAPLRFVLSQAFLSNQRKQGVEINAALDSFKVKYKIKGPINTPTITLLPEGVYMIYNGNLGASDELVISYSNGIKQALLNSNNDVSNLLNEFYGVGMNRNLVTLNGTNFNSNTKLTVEIQGSYLGI